MNAIVLSKFDFIYLLISFIITQVLTTKNFFLGPPSEFVGEWVQVDLGKPTHMVRIVTQGRPSGANQYITRYTIAYGNSTSTFNTIQRRTGGDLVIIKIKMLLFKLLICLEKAVLKSCLCILYIKKVSMSQHSNSQIFTMSRFLVDHVLKKYTALREKMQDVSNYFHLKVRIVI